MLKKCKKPDDVLFINAAEHFVKGKRQNQLTAEHIAKIIDTYQHRTRKSSYSRRVAMETHRERGLQPQHLPLHQHGTSRGCNRFEGGSPAIGGHRKGNHEGKRQTQRVS